MKKVVATATATATHPTGHVCGLRQFPPLSRNKPLRCRLAEVISKGTEASNTPMVLGTPRPRSQPSPSFLWALGSPNGFSYPSNQANQPNHANTALISANGLVRISIASKSRSLGDISSTIAEDVIVEDVIA